MSAFFRLIWIALGILTVDIVSKAMTHFYLNPFELSPHFFPFGGVSIFQAFGIDFCIHHVTNRGMAWGVGSGLQTLILLARIGVVVGLTGYLCFSAKAYERKYALVMIIAGGLGNVLDYFIYGHVIDMFHFIFWGYSYPVFNVADASIFLGIATLLWQSRKQLAHVADE